ncbi:N-6 DNA methylase [Puerhibacterium sp. TATVAM-FAB25]|uniref:type I restriction-modification system subunit M n=1 Tax=Puerhibacterium sp. TATVAM-FAB25 TaxID=3093699 RepID=UPI00397B59AD
MENWGEKVSFIWSIKEILRDHYKRHEYGQVILPLAVIRRLDCVLEGTKVQVLARAETLPGSPDDHFDLLAITAGQQFYNTSKFTIEALLDDPDNIADNLRFYLNAYSPNARDVIDKFDFFRHIDRMDRSGILYAVIKRFTEIDLHPDAVSNLEMGYLYEELVRVAADLSNEEAGEHFTPREVIRLMVNLLLADDRGLDTKGKVFTAYDPTCGTGGMLTEAEHRLRDVNPSAKVHLFGQEVSPESYAVCRSDMMLKGQDASNIKFGSTLTEDGFPDRKFSYILANPPYGKDWKTEKAKVEAEHKNLGMAGRFGPGLPSTSDGQMLFILHMVSKMRPVEEGGARVAVVVNGSPLFSGDAGSGPSEIRRWLIQNDLLEAIVGLPDQMFYNTGINTFIWVLTNKKAPERQGYVQLVDARQMVAKMPKSLGNKRNMLTEKHLTDITALYESFTESEVSKILPNEAFGYRKVVVDRPLRARWTVTDAAIEAVAALGAVAKLPKADQETLIGKLAGMVGTTAETEANFRGALASALDAIGAKAPLRTAVAKACLVRDSSAASLTDGRGRALPDVDLRDSENVPLDEAVADYMDREVLPYVDDAWVADPEGRLGYEIPFTRLFYKYTPPRPLHEIDAEIKFSQRRILKMLGEVAE